MAAGRVLFWWALAAMMWRSVAGRREVDPWDYLRTWLLVGVVVAAASLV